ncbi:hypothetical protein NDA03_00565 [Trichocoleus sp. Lan]|uniref:hypothetical protein n=1 Tax=Trichocoleus sp. Lan TaxID=2933927 RepID=UPI003299106F
MRKKVVLDNDKSTDDKYQFERSRGFESDRAAGGCPQATLKKRYWSYGLLR